MKKLFKENPGAVIVAFLLIGVLVVHNFIPGNAIYEAPALNKIIFLVLVGAGYLFGRLAAKGEITLGKSDNVNIGLVLLVEGILAVLAFAVLISWHGGPIKSWL